MLFYADEILSTNIRRREPEGFLICTNVPIARSGTQRYLMDELGEDGGGSVMVYRPEEEVFSEVTMSSFEGMPVTNDHPDAEEGVTVNNAQYLTKGHCQNVRRGEGKDSDLLIADLVIFDPMTIQEIMDGKREISCGYNYELCEENGRYVQRQIRGNHVAIVDKGRAGKRVCIKDSATTNERRKPKMPKKKNYSSIMAKALAALVANDAEPEDIEEMVDAIEDITTETPAEPETKVTDSEELNEKLDKITDMLQQGAAPEAEAEEEPVVADEEPDKLDIVIDLLKQLIATKPTADEEPEVDPLDKLEDDLDELEGKGEEPEALEDDENEEVVEEEEEELIPDEDPAEPESHFVDPTEINEEDEEPEELPEEEEESPKPQLDKRACDAMRAAIKAVKPVIAKLPPSERRAASDAAVASIRKSYGMTGKPSRNDYLKLKNRKQSFDSIAAERKEAETLEARIKARNANYKK